MYAILFKFVTKILETHTLLLQANASYYTAAFNPNGFLPSHLEAYHKGLELLQKELEFRGTKFLHSDEPGLVDYTIFPQLERFESLPLLGKPEMAIEKTKYERLVSIFPY